MFFHLMFMSQAALKQCGLVRGNYLRLRFSMRAVVDRDFLSFLFPKLTQMRPDLHKQTFGGFVSFSMWLSATASTFLACDPLNWSKAFSWPPITDCMWRHFVLCVFFFLLSKSFCEFPQNSWPKSQVLAPGLRTTELVDTLPSQALNHMLDFVR